MSHITWISPYLDIVLDEVSLDAKKILEVGCGYGIFGFILKKTRRDATVEGIEPFDYSLGHYDKLYKMDWKTFFKDNEYDYNVIICNETVEHMEKCDALDFLDQAKSIAPKVIVGTPYQFDQQDAYDGNPYQVHKCVITEKDFHKKGYVTKRLGFSKNGIRYYHEPSIQSKLLRVTPMNIIAVYNKLNSY